MYDVGGEVSLLILGGGIAFSIGLAVLALIGLGRLRRR